MYGNEFKKTTWLLSAVDTLKKQDIPLKPHGKNERLEIAAYIFQIVKIIGNKEIIHIQLLNSEYSEIRYNTSYSESCVIVKKWRSDQRVIGNQCIFVVQFDRFDYLFRFQ